MCPNPTLAPGMPGPAQRPVWCGSLGVLHQAPGAVLLSARRVRPPTASKQRVSTLFVGCKPLRFHALLRVTGLNPDRVPDRTSAYTVRRSQTCKCFEVGGGSASSRAWYTYASLLQSGTLPCAHASARFGGTAPSPAARARMCSEGPVGRASMRVSTDALVSVDTVRTSACAFQRCGPACASFCSGGGGPLMHARVC